MNTTETTRANLMGLIEGLTSGKLLEAFDRYYHDDVVMSENLDPEQTTVGKAANRAREEWMVANSEWFGAKIGAVVVDGDQSAYEMWADMAIAGQRSARTQVAVQAWKDGKIIKETFFYKP